MPNLEPFPKMQDIAENSVEVDYGAVAPHLLGVESFIVDTGCGHNLIQQSTVDGVGGNKHMKPLD
eukprot:3144866-Prorocentrum_lima.AAC.1